MSRRVPSATLWLLASIACFWAALWLPCVVVPGAGRESVYSGAHLIFVTVGSLYGLAASTWTAGPTFESWYLVPLANIVFIAAPWIWTAHPRSKLSDRTVTALVIGAAALAGWTTVNFVLAYTGWWADPAVQSFVSLFPSLPWQLELGALTWAASAVFLTLALRHHRREQVALLARWDARPGIDALHDEPSHEQVAWLPGRLAALVLQAHHLRLELDALGPVDGWRFRLLGDWARELLELSDVEQLTLARYDVQPWEIAEAVLPACGGNDSGNSVQRFGELLRIDAALHHFTQATLHTAPMPYR